MRTPTAYYGGKVRMAPKIVALMGPHRSYCEPFAGALSVLLAKSPSTHEVVNDLDGHVVNFWQQLRDRPEDLQRVCEATPYARAEFESCAELDADDDLERARRWWVRVNQSHSRIPHGTGWSTGFARTGSRAHETWRSAQRIATVASRLRTVSIECRPAVECIAAYDGPETLHYVDPPYLGTSDRNIDRKRMYGVDMHSDGEHRELAEVLATCRGHVLLSGYASPLYEDLYDGWDRIEFDALRSNGGRPSTRARATEVVWSNRPMTSSPQLFGGAA